MRESITGDGGRNQMCFDIMVQDGDLWVETRTRKFAGKVTGCYVSPYSGRMRVCIVDYEGRVHNFHPDTATLSTFNPGWPDEELTK